MYEHNVLGYRSGFALCLTKVRSSQARCPATALIFWAIGIIVISFKGEDIGNMFPICISDGFLYMCSEPFVL